MNIPSLKPEARYTYADYLIWPDDERWELIAGRPYLMTPAPSTEHQRITREIAAQLYRYLRDKSCEFFSAPFDVRLPRGDEDDADIDTVVQPDIIVVCDREKLDERGCKGAPDMVIEILSHSTAKKDLHDKYMLYERSGIKEYWVVFPLEKALDIYTLGEGNSFTLQGQYRYPDKVRTDLFADLEIDLAQVFGG